MMLLAHHFEMAFIPIYAAQFALGIWVGWRMMSLVSMLAYKAAPRRHRSFDAQLTDPGSFKGRLPNDSPEFFVHGSSLAVSRRSR